MGDIEYRVVSGDTLHAIARRYAVTVDALCRINGLSDVNRIWAGQRLRIPRESAAAPSSPAQLVTHRVLAGETLSKIAQRHHVTVESLTHANGIGDPDHIRIGQVLKIPLSSPSPSQSTKARVSPSESDVFRDVASAANSATLKKNGGYADPKVAIVQGGTQFQNRVAFSQLGNSYGFDDCTSQTEPWVSVEVGKTNTVSATYTSAGRAAKIFFKSLDTKNVKVSPAFTTSATQAVTVEGVRAGEATVQALYNNAVIGQFKVKVCNRRFKTVAVRLIHGEYFDKTKEIPDTDISEFLKKVYEQAVFEFKLTRLPEMTVSFDLDEDGSLNDTSWMTKEMAVIRDRCKNDRYDYNVFIVSKSLYGFAGMAERPKGSEPPSKYVYVFSDENKTPSKVVAHELGHAAFEFGHEPEDRENVMSQGEGNYKWRLRKRQWDKINP
jgi:LysM repeat protein